MEKTTIKKTSVKRTTTSKASTETSKKTVTKKVKETIEPEFKSIKEEIAWLKKKKDKDEIDEQRLAFLEQPVRVIGPTKKELAEAKKLKKRTTRKPAKPVVKLENGEFVPTPTTFAKLRPYIAKYCKAMGWNKKNFIFPDTKSLSIDNFKIVADTDNKTVKIQGKLIFQSSKQMFTKLFVKEFTLENHDIRSTIINTYKVVNKIFKGKELIPTKYFDDHGWSMVYDA